MKCIEISGSDIVETVRAALQFISFYHSKDYLSHLSKAYEREESAPARAAIGQILESSRLAAIGQRPMCQDTGMVTVFARLGQDAHINSDKPLSDLINEVLDLHILTQRTRFARLWLMTHCLIEGIQKITRLLLHMLN